MLSCKLKTVMERWQAKDKEASMSETHAADFRSPSETQAAGLRLRAGRFEDAETCGSICYSGFQWT